MVDITPITPPRVPLVDLTTGLITREWFLFLLNLYTRDNNNQTDVDGLIKAPPPNFTTAADVAAGVQTAVLEAYSPTSDAAYYTLVNAIQSLPVGVSIDQLAALQNEIQSLAVGPTHTPHLHRKSYGSFYDTTDQTAAAVNTAYAITYNATLYSLGVYTGTPTSRVYVDRPGLYNIQFSAQLDKSAGASGNVWIWLDKNGTAEANSATQITLQGASSATVAAWNFLLEMNSGDYFRLMWATDDTNCFLKHDTSPFAPVPAIPSMILTVTNNINDNTSY